MEEIALFYARKDVGGGSTSFTVHMHAGFTAARLPFKLYRFTDKPKKPRMLAKYDGVVCEYVTPEQALRIVKRQPSLLLAPEHGKNLPEQTLLPDLMRAGMRVVIHDPNEFIVSSHARAVYDHLTDRSIIRDPFCIRPSMQTHFPDARFIPHPYKREFSGVPAWSAPRKTACSISRLTFVKRPMIAMEANEQLPPRRQIQFHGAENRLFTKFKVMAKYPDFKQGGYNLPMEWGVSARKAAEYRFAVDMTYFPLDGGGSQYTFMEAWDAGTINVIHKDWLRYEGEMKHWVNCVAVDGPEQLVKLLQEYDTNRFQKALQPLVANGVEQLQAFHDPAKVARTYYRALT